MIIFGGTSRVIFNYYTLFTLYRRRYIHGYIRSLSFGTLSFLLKCCSHQHDHARKSYLRRSSVQVISEEEFSAALHLQTPHAIHIDCSLIPIYYFNAYVGLQARRRLGILTTIQVGPLGSLLEVAASNKQPVASTSVTRCQSP